MGDSLAELAGLIQKGLGVPEGAVKQAVADLFGSRYPKQASKACQVRYAYSLASETGDSGVPWAGLINPDNPPSGPYGGTSLVWFPTESDGSLIGLGVGTRGISPDEGILTRPGHRRRIAALRRYLASYGVAAWSKPDPAALSMFVPEVVRLRWPEFGAAFKRYGAEMYCIAKVPEDNALALRVVQGFFDLYALERGWKPLKQAEGEYEAFHGVLRRYLFQPPSAQSVYELVSARRFVVLQGPPGTGKTRLAELVKAQFFAGQGMTIQFHPSITYEDFVVGLSPDTDERQLRFEARRGALLEAADAAADSPYLLVIDEVNRADLGKVLGEAIYLLEPDEIGGATPREVRLPHAIDGSHRFRFPPNLFILATMNTADRSIAAMDLAIRRRFAFVTMPPEREVVAAQGVDLALEVFDQLADVFVEHAPDDALDLLPGHAYFIAPDERALAKRIRFELLPLLEEYIRQGFLGAATSELQAVRDAIADRLEQGVTEG